MADPAYIVDGVLTDGPAWIALASTALGSDASDVTWTNPDDGSSLDWSQFMDLVIIAYCRGTKSAANIQYHLNFNDDVGSNYAFQRFDGDGSNDGAYKETTNTRAEIHFIPGATVTANVFGSVINHLYDVNSGKYKVLTSRAANDQNGAGTIALFSNVWRNPAAINKIKVWPDTNDWLAGSRFDLFGILPRMVA
jgi:hypothetical protein